MKNFKKMAAVVAAVTVLATGAAFAAEANTSANTPSNTAASLDEFKAQMLEQKKTILDQRVKDGVLTQEKADEIYNAIKENQATCDGTGSAKIGQKLGAGFKMGRGQGQQGQCQAAGQNCIGGQGQTAGQNRMGGQGGRGMRAN